MANTSEWDPFLSYWWSYCKKFTSMLRIGEGQEELEYSEGLLSTLYYETDVGCIPRGIKLGSQRIRPKFGDTENWNKQIEGCYWCVDDETSWRGICCSIECFFYLHDWCIERIEHFTKRRFCRLPGCNENIHREYLYCNGNHRTQFELSFPQWANHKSFVKKVISVGPTWYSRTIPIALLNSEAGKSNISKTRSQTQHKTNSPLPKSDPFSMDFPNTLLNKMIFKTDIGPIPRQDIEEQHLASPYSSSPNWLREITGCVRCGNKSITLSGDANFCAFRCYVLFYEWARRLVQSLTGVKLCRDPGCDKLAGEGVGCCSREHANALEVIYSQVKFGDFEKLTVLCPYWYKKCDFPNDIAAKLFAKSPKQIRSPPASLHIPGTVPVNLLSHSLPIVPRLSTERIQLIAARYEGNTNDNLIIEESRSLPKPDISQNVNLIPANTPRPKNELNANDATYSSLYDPFNSSNLDIIPDEAKYQLPADYICPFDIPQTDNMDTELGIPSSRFPTLPTKLITPIDAEASEGIHTQLATTDKVARSNTINTRSNLRLQKSQSLIERNPQQNITLPDIYPFSLSTQLINTLSQHTDVGVIPRHRATRPPAPRELSPLTNWGAEIAGCYWCQLSNTSFHELTCGRRCWLLFHEWCVRKTESSSGARLCALPGCENSRASGCACCSLEHIGDLTELRGRAALSTEDEVELILGPSWYSDLSPIHFSRTGAFYEFSNNFPSLLLLEGSIWPTVYHYLCARKLVGTPYSNHILRMECVKELEMWMKRRTCAKWARTDWSGVWEGDTYRAVLAKFQQNSVLRGLLLRTGRRPLVCRDSSLGDVLVGLRERFKTQRFFPAAQPEASIDSVCRYINNPGIVSKPSLTPSQDRVTESLPTITSVKSIQIPINKDSQPVVATRCRSDSNSDSD